MMRLDGFENLMRDIDRLERQVAVEAIEEGLRTSGRLLVERMKAKCPVGDADHNPEAKPLRETIGAEYRDYGATRMVIVGPQYPAGAHGHLVEFGHVLVLHGKSVGFVQGKPFVRPAYDESAEDISASFQQAIQRRLS